MSTAVATPPAEFAEVPLDDYGPNWLRGVGKTLSPEGEQVARFVDWLFGGIYHQRRAVIRADWSRDFVKLNLSCDLASYDADTLTRLVVGAHDRAIRVSITPCNFRFVTVWFHPRRRDGANFYERHPAIETALAKMVRPEIVA